MRQDDCRSNCDRRRIDRGIRKLSRRETGGLSVARSESQTRETIQFWRHRLLFNLLTNQWGKKGQKTSFRHFLGKKSVNKIISFIDIKLVVYIFCASAAYKVGSGADLKYNQYSNN